MKNTNTVSILSVHLCRGMAVAVLLLCALGVFGQAKVVNSSSKNAPSWVGKTQQGYLIVSAEGKSLDEAKDKCLEAIKIQMLASVANNVESEANTTITSHTRNQNVDSRIDFQQVMRSAVATLPYISGVTLAKTSDSYWAQTYNKATKESLYGYHVRYPFSSADHRQLAEEFNRIDDEMTAIVSEYEGKEATMQSVEQINAATAKLERAVAYFFDKTRRQRASAVLESYRKLIGQIVIQHELGYEEADVWLSLGGRLITTDVTPKLAAECATYLSVSRQDDGKYKVTFSTEDCIQDAANTIEVTFRIGGRAKKHIIEL